MNELKLQEVSREIIERAENSIVPDQGLPQVADDYFIERLKRDEMQYAEVDARHYEGLRQIFNREVSPLYEAFQRIRDRILERKQKRKLGYYVLGTIAILEILEVILTKGRSLVPTILIPTAIIDGFIGFVIYAAAQYKDDVLLARARRRLERSVEGLDHKLQTDLDYDNRRKLMDAEVLKGEALEIIAQYERPEDFWHDYLRVRRADPTSAADLKSLATPRFEKFLKFHLEGGLSPVARQNRFNSLFLEAQAIFISKDRENYVQNHLKFPKETIE